MPLCKAQIDWSTVNRSPNLYGNGGSLEIAEATADFRKSIAKQMLLVQRPEGLSKASSRIGLCIVVHAVIVLALLLQVFAQFA